MLHATGPTRARRAGPVRIPGPAPPHPRTPAPLREPVHGPPHPRPHPMALRTGAGSRGPAAGSRGPGVLQRCGGRSARTPATPPPCRRCRRRLRRSPAAGAATAPGPPPGGPSPPAAQRCPAPAERGRGGYRAPAPRAGQRHRCGQQAQGQDDGLVPGPVGPRAARAAVPAGTAAPVQRRLPVITTAPPSSAYRPRPATLEPPGPSSPGSCVTTMSRCCKGTGFGAPARPVGH